MHESGTLSPGSYINARAFFGVAGFSLKIEARSFSTRFSKEPLDRSALSLDVFVCFCNMALSLVAQRRDLADTHYCLRS